MNDTALANKLAALAQAIADETRPMTEDLGSADAAALLALAARDAMTVGEIALAVALSQSAAVRLVDRLERSWLVHRRRRVSREVMVEPTVRGRRRAAMLAELRLKAAGRFVSDLEPSERAALASLIDRIVATQGSRMDAGRLSAEFHCRFCSRSVCDCGLHASD